MNQQIKKLRGYLTPEAELFEVKIETGLLTFSQGVSGNSSTRDLMDSEDSVDNPIWG